MRIYEMDGYQISVQKWTASIHRNNQSEDIMDMPILKKKKRKKKEINTKLAIAKKENI